MAAQPWGTLDEAYGPAGQLNNHLLRGRPPLEKRHRATTQRCWKSSIFSAPRMIVCKASEIEFSKLRITRAYIKLLCVPEGAAKIVSLARIGNYEVRMLESSQNDSDAAPLFSIELFDHDAQLPVDSCTCFDIDEGAAAFRNFISR